MKRIISACLEQTLRFDFENDTDPKADVEAYLAKMRLTETFQIVERQDLDDGTIILKIKKNYNNYSTEGYID